jgi:hypothetical protein
MSHKQTKIMLSFCDTTGKATVLLSLLSYSKDLLNFYGSCFQIERRKRDEVLLRLDSVTQQAFSRVVDCEPRFRERSLGA